MIAENGVHTERRPEARERARPFRRRDRAAHEAVVSHIVAEQQDQVRRQCVRVDDDPLDALEVHPRLAGVDIGDERDPKVQILRPPGQTGAVTRDVMGPGLDAEGVAGKAEAGEPQTCCGLQQCATREHSASNPVETIKGPAILLRASAPARSRGIVVVLCGFKEAGLSGGCARRPCEPEMTVGA